MKRPALLLVATLAVSCQSAIHVEPTPPPVSASNPTIIPTPTTTGPTPTKTTPPATAAPPSTIRPTGDYLADGAELTILVPRFGVMSERWRQRVFGYGDVPELLATAPGGEGLMLGPEYGTQTGDGRWWFMDAARPRIAGYGPDGSFQEEVTLGPDVLVDGVYFQYQMPQALDDGSLAVGGFRDMDETALLRVVNGSASVATFPGSVPWVTTDGRYLYGLDFDGNPHRLDPADPVAEPVDFLRTRGGEPFLVTIDGDALAIAFPERKVSGRLMMRSAADPDVVVRGGIEVESGEDGTVFILFLGAPENDERTGVGTLITINPDLAVSSEAVVDPFSPADPGSPAHLGVTPGTSHPWLMAVYEDGVHVFVLGD